MWGGSSTKKRNKQLKSLSRVRGCTSLSRDQSQWRVSVHTRFGNRNLFITLPQGFPNVPPRLHIDQGQQHHLADGSGTIVHLPMLKQWTSNSDVGSVVNSCINALIANPPQAAGQGQPPRPSGGWGQPPMQQGFGQQRAQTFHQPFGGAANVQYQQPSMRANTMPPQKLAAVQAQWGAAPGGQKPPEPMKGPQEVPKKDEDSDLAAMTFSIPSDIWQIPRLQGLTDKEMQDIVGNDAALRSLAYQCASPLRDMKHGTQQALLTQAKINLRRKEEIDNLSRECRDVREEVNTLIEIFEKLREQQQEILQKFSPANIVVELDKAIAAVEEECEKIHERLETEEISYVTFVKQLTTARTDYHMLCAKKEKFVALYG